MGIVIHQQHQQRQRRRRVLINRPAILKYCQAGGDDESHHPKEILNNNNNRPNEDHHQDAEVVVNKEDCPVKKVADCPMKQVKRVRFDETNMTQCREIPPVLVEEVPRRWYTHHDYSSFAYDAAIRARGLMLDDGVHHLWEYITDFCRDPEASQGSDAEHEVEMIQQNLVAHYRECDDAHGLESYLPLAFPATWATKQHQARTVVRTMVRMRQIANKHVVVKEDEGDGFCMADYYRSASLRISFSRRMLARATAVCLHQSLVQDNAE